MGTSSGTSVPHKCGWWGSLGKKQCTLRKRTSRSGDDKLRARADVVFIYYVKYNYPVCITDSVLHTFSNGNSNGIVKPSCNDCFRSLSCSILITSCYSSWNNFSWNNSRNNSSWNNSSWNNSSPELNSYQRLCQKILIHWKCFHWAQRANKRRSEREIQVTAITIVYII